jgi:hypothetical protein
MCASFFNGQNRGTKTKIHLQGAKWLGGRGMTDRGEEDHDDDDNAFEMGLKRSDASLVERNVSLACLFACGHNRLNLTQTFFGGP